MKTYNCDEQEDDGHSNTDDVDNAGNTSFGNVDCVACSFAGLILSV
jgi:hypothetical protein